MIRDRLAAVSEELRPTFEECVSLSAVEVEQRVRCALKGRDCPVRGVATAERIELHASDQDQHFSSPQLIVDYAQTGDDSTTLRGRFGPHPNVWPLLVALYAA